MQHVPRENVKNAKCQSGLAQWATATGTVVQREGGTCVFAVCNLAIVNQLATLSLFTAKLLSD